MKTKSHPESRSVKPPITDEQLRAVLRRMASRLRAAEARLAELERRADDAEWRI